ncbi:MAG TPA: FABP family protein [Candidatus Dormibacteraeota bacterium]|nr:FABP family protein [Candidatus Dormibacteraeota bacterium]
MPDAAPPPTPAPGSRDPHPGLAPLAFLVGRWVGEGRGLWAAEPPYRYREQLTFTHDGRPFLAYEQLTWELPGGQPRHREAGFLSLDGAGGVRWVAAQVIGIVETAAGTVRGTACEVVTAGVAHGPGAAPVTAVGRRWWLEGASLHSLTRLGVNGEPLTDHVRAVLALDATAP